MIKEYLNQPYPLFGNYLKISISVSVFISVFMFVFQPFGLSGVRGDLRTYVEIGYGTITFAVLMFNLVVFSKWVRIAKWTVLKQIIWQMWILFSIGFGNFLYSSFFLSFSNNYKAFLYFQFYTLVVGVIPVVVITILQQNLLLAQNLRLANEFSNELNLKQGKLLLEELICLTSENGKDKIQLNLSDLIYIGSTGNYVQIFYMKDDKLQNILLRNTLKQIEDQLIDSESILKCHRAFLVNKDRIIQVNGNSQGLRLVLKDANDEIPVSRNFAKSMKHNLNY